MSTQLTLAGLLLRQTQATIYAAALKIATKIGLPVTTWQAGDPTRSLFYLEAEILEAVESTVIGFIQSGFLDFAAVPNADGTVNPWLAILAKQVFNVDVPTATYATTTVNLTNTGGGLYVMEPGDLSFSCSTTGATFHSTSAVTLTGVGTPGATGSVTVVADVAGSDGSAAAGEIDTVVTGLLGVTCTNPAAAVGIDAQDPQTTVSQCHDKGASLSPNGPAAAYSFVARNPALTGVLTVTRARTYPDSETGSFPVYIAGAGGAISGDDVAKVQAAISKWAGPLCFTPTVIAATPVTVAITYEIWLYESVGLSSGQIEGDILAGLEAYFALRPIGGDVTPPATTGALYQSEIAAVIGRVYPTDTLRVVVTPIAGSTLIGGDYVLSMGQGDVPALGTVTPTIHSDVPDPS